jgi:DNA-binding response OmpR family regulator
MEARDVFAFGQYRRDERIGLSVIAQEASLGIRMFDDVKEACSWLDQNTPHVLLVDNSAVDAEQICLEARAQARQALTPIISLSRKLDDLSFAEVFSWGGDDAVELGSVYSLLSRVRSLPREPLAQSSASRGVAIVADPDRSRRVVRARVLRNAGYDIQFAVTAEDAVTRSQRDSARLLVLDEDLEDGPQALVEAAKKNKQTLHILMCAPKNFKVRAEAVSGLENATVADSFAPPENVVFLANELARGGASDQRKSRRLLYGTKVTFRGEGRAEDEYGYSYNISDGGLYVRTLAPPQDDYVWVELCPPRCDRRVRLEGQVVWRRAYGLLGSSTVPPGFGLKIVDGTRRNMQAWFDGYQAFCAALGVPDSE